MSKVAIVIGGGERVFEDIIRADDFCVANNLVAEYFPTNAMIAEFPYPCTAVTLHPDKLGRWLTERQNKKLPMPVQVWSHNGGDSKQKPNPRITDRLTDWGGSVGLFGYVVARAKGHDRIILCGVPMTNDNHFQLKKKWIAVTCFTRAWETRRIEMTPFVKSLSGGMTGDMFGEPTPEWIAPPKVAVEPESPHKEEHYVQQ